MSRLNDSGALAMGAMAAAMFSVGMSLAVVACGSGSQPNDAAKADAKAHAVTPIASVGAAVAARTADALLNSQQTVSSVTSAAPTTSTQDVRTHSSEGVVVKRFVVAQGIHEREPVTNDGPLTVNGKPIYAFAELANENSGATSVRITFERKGSSDRVGNVTLSVPAKAGRYRTWGQTRFVRDAGTWDAVLWSESGKELGRTTFDVVGS
ncbi:MAG TPA: DUF2914 domain-containing protein [Polyangiaceae bacterium]|nr:DUF2914 domain-containing protein [Polyangiaceae bacterium]